MKYNQDLYCRAKRLIQVLLILMKRDRSGGGAVPVFVSFHFYFGGFSNARFFLLNGASGGYNSYVMEQSAYRIIDANFNRAREALRVIEDFCRFSLNSAEYSGRAKELRHILCSAVMKLGIERLISSRDTVGDVGVGRKVAAQLSRVDLLDCLTAGSKRLTEALRVLSEVTQSIDREVSEEIERLRYSVYSFEKEVFLLSRSLEKFRSVSLYVIITSNLPGDIFSLATKCATGGADCIQLRAKDIKTDVFFSVAKEFVEICRSLGVVSIINDRADIAIASGADGVHLGQNDLPIEQVRKLELSPLIIGRSTHTLEQLRAGCLEAATYVSLGPVFPTATKPEAEPVGLEYVRDGINELSDKASLAVAIGGITVENVEQVLQAGAKRIAVCSAVTEAEDPRSACEELKARIVSFGAD